MSGDEQRNLRLFSYGTLRLEQVQLDLFGRRLEGEADAVLGFALSTVTFDDPEIVEQSGTATHAILIASEGEPPPVEGTVFLLSAAELAAADEYEIAPYVRVEAPLRSGGVAWVYVKG